MKVSIFFTLVVLSTNYPQVALGATCPFIGSPCLAHSAGFPNQCGGDQPGVRSCLEGCACSPTQSLPPGWSNFTGGQFPGLCVTNTVQPPIVCNFGSCPQMGGADGVCNLQFNCCEYVVQPLITATSSITPQPTSSSQPTSSATSTPVPTPSPTQTANPTPTRTASPSVSPTCGACSSCGNACDNIDSPCISEVTSCGCACAQTGFCVDNEASLDADLCSSGRDCFSFCPSCSHVACVGGCCECSGCPPSASPQPTPSSRPTQSQTSTIVVTASRTSTQTPTASRSDTLTPTASRSDTLTPTHTPSNSLSASATRTLSRSPTETPSAPRTGSQTASNSRTPHATKQPSSGNGGGSPIWPWIVVPLVIGAVFIVLCVIFWWLLSSRSAPARQRRYIMVVDPNHLHY